MRIESLSIKMATITIFFMIGIFAVVLSLLAGAYFKQSALDAQMNSLSRVIEVATDEMFKDVRANTFDLGMRLAYSRELIDAFVSVKEADGYAQLVNLLDDPFINGFVGFQKINLEKIRIYNLKLEFVAESNRGIVLADKNLDHHLRQQISKQHGIDRLKAMDDLWMSSKGPLYSTLVPIGGLRILGYLEIIINPAHNLPEIAKITKTPVSVFSSSGHPVNISDQAIKEFLPVKYTLLTSDGEPAYRIVGYENVDKLNQEMGTTQIITTIGFLVLTVLVLLFALRLFHRFLFSPVSQMIVDMEQVAHGNLDLTVNKKGLKEFYILAEAFNLMADQVKMRTNELRDSQNRLLHLLDLDNSAILCFGNKNDVVYFNQGASDFFGYSNDEMNDLEFSDLFADDVDSLLQQMSESSIQVISKARLQCYAKNGSAFYSDAIMNRLSVMGESGFAVVLNSMPVSENEIIEQNLEQATAPDEQGMKEVEQSLKRILEIASNNPGLLLGVEGSDLLQAQLVGLNTAKTRLREQAVSVMHSALACWEHDLGRSKLDLAETSKIWPVYIDKSTPTTRTMDKYLHIDSCPKNPRCQRVVDTAEFVLKQLGDQRTSHQQKLVHALQLFRQSISGV